MSNSDPDMGPISLGNTDVRLTPHYLPGIGTRVLVTLDSPMMHAATNLSADQARALADYLKIAACKAEAMQSRALRKTHNGV
jgi:hypothetical protein